MEGDETRVTYKVADEVHPKKSEIYIKKIENIDYDVPHAKKLKRFDLFDCLRELKNGEQEDGTYKVDLAVGVFGTRRTGKSYYMRDKLYHLRKVFYGVVVITATRENGFWNQIVPPTAIYTVNQMDRVIAHIIRQQKHLSDIIRTKKVIPKRNPYFLIILDDWVTDPKIARHSTQINTLCMNGRHLLISVWMATQYPKAVSTFTRYNLDLSVIMRQNSVMARDQLLEDHLCFSDNKREQTKLVNDVTQNYRCLVVQKNRSEMKNLKDVYYWDKADDTPPEYTLGDKKYWEDKGYKKPPDGKFFDYVDAEKSETSKLDDMCKLNVKMPSEILSGMSPLAASLFLMRRSTRV